MRALPPEWRLPMWGRPAVVEAVQCIINKSLLQRLGRRNNGAGDNGIRCPMEVVAGSRPALLQICPSPLRKYKEMNALKMKRATEISNVEALHRALADIHKEVSTRNEQTCSTAQAIYNVRTNVLRYSFEMGNFLIVIMHTKQ